MLICLSIFGCFLAGFCPAIFFRPFYNVFLDSFLLAGFFGPFFFGRFLGRPEADLKGGSGGREPPQFRSIFRCWSIVSVFLIRQDGRRLAAGGQSSLAVPSQLCSAASGWWTVGGDRSALVFGVYVNIKVGA